MPIYPYICGTCGHEFDKLQKVSDDPDKHCPECGEESLRRKVTAAAFHLKGTGWYVTDFKDKGGKKDQKEERKGEAKGEDKAETKGKAEDKKSDSKTTDSGSSSSTSKNANTKSESTKADSN